MLFLPCQFRDPRALGSWKLTTARGIWTEVLLTSTLKSLFLSWQEKLFLWGATLLDRWSTQRGSKERENTWRVPCPVTSLLSPMNAYDPRPTCHHLPTDGTGGIPQGCPTYSKPSLIHSVPQKSVRGCKKRTPIFLSHDCTLWQLFQCECGGWVWWG